MKLLFLKLFGILFFVTLLFLAGHVSSISVFLGFFAFMTAIMVGGLFVIAAEQFNKKKNR